VILAGTVMLAALFAADAAPVGVEIYAVQATKEERSEVYFDPGLEPIRQAVADLEFNTYKKVKTTVISAPPETETAVQINDRYTLYIQPLNAATGGQTRLNVRIELAPRAPGEKPKTAIATTVAMAASKQVKLRGLKMDSGELVLVLGLR